MRRAASAQQQQRDDEDLLPPSPRDIVNSQPPARGCLGLPAKYLALFLLVLQTVGSVLALRLSRTRADPENPYLGTTVVCMTELVKLVASLGLMAHDCKWKPRRTLRALKATTYGEPLEFLKAGVPALIYTVQNNLIVIALSNLSAAAYQVTYQLKILTTALLSVILLKRSLGLNKWFALFLLTVGVALIEFHPKSESTSLTGGSVSTGLIAVLFACMTSGLAGVYLEMILKGSKLSIWSRNVQLALYGVVSAFIGAYAVNGHEIVEGGGWFQGYTHWVVLVIAMQSLGGLIIAAVLKYADNILKCFGNALAIIFAACISAWLGDENLSLIFVAGTLLVVVATFAYGTDFHFSRLLPGAATGKWRAAARKGSLPDAEKGNLMMAEIETNDDSDGAGAGAVAVHR